MHKYEISETQVSLQFNIFSHQAIKLYITSILTKIVLQRSMSMLGKERLREQLSKNVAELSSVHYNFYEHQCTQKHPTLHPHLKIILTLPLTCVKIASFPLTTSYVRIETDTFAPSAVYDSVCPFHRPSTSFPLMSLGSPICFSEPSDVKCDTPLT